MVDKRPSYAYGLRGICGTVLVAVTALLITGGCSNDARRQSQPPTPTTGEMNAYFHDVNTILSRTYGRFDQLVRIFDDASYTEALDLNGRRFKAGAHDLRGIQVPESFKSAHAAFVDTLAEVADQLAASRQRIEDGDKVSDVIGAQIDGPLAEAFNREDDACKQLLRQAEEFGIYDAIPCGGDPHFIQAAEPPWSHRVFVNRCCGGSDPASDPLDIFYGSDEPWERTATHYEQEMEKRGFELQTRGRTLVFSKPDRPEECFSVEEYSAGNLPLAVKPSDVAGLGDYAYAYVTGYIMVCGG